MNLKGTILTTIGAGVVATSSYANFAGTVTVTGSDTLLILNQAWAEDFQKASSGAVAVRGGGSSIGINALINSATDICASSRQMKKSERDKARSRGIVVNEIPVALDGLAIIVNASNKVDSLSMDELRKIYIGQITNWSQVGGANEPITVFSRDSNSGTYGFFQQVVLKNQNWGKSVRFMPSTSEEIRETTRSEGGIAYGGVAYFKNKRGIKILSVSAKAGSPALAPNEANVRNRSYPIWRFLYYYTNGAPKGDTKNFVNFALSAQGQKLVERVGYYSLK